MNFFFLLSFSVTHTKYTYTMRVPTDQASSGWLFISFTLSLSLSRYTILNYIFYLENPITKQRYVCSGTHTHTIVWRLRFVKSGCCSLGYLVVACTFWLSDFHFENYTKKMKKKTKAMWPIIRRLRTYGMRLRRSHACFKHFAHQSK